MNLWTRTAVRALREYSPEGIAVPRTDHPLLFRGPDLLYGEPGLLLALYSPTSRELRNLDLLLARVAVGRLALPAKTICALVNPTREASADKKQLSHHFDAAIDASEPAEYSRLVREFSGSDRIRVPPDVKHQWFLAYDRRLAVAASVKRSRSSEKSEWHRSLEGARPVSVEPWTEGVRSMVSRRPLRNLSSNGDVSLVASSAKRAKTRTESECLTAVRFRYALDNGVPYARQAEPLLVPISGSSYPKFDPGWDIRVTAFSGAIPFPADLTNDSWLRLIDRVADRRADL